MYLKPIFGAAFLILFVVFACKEEEEKEEEDLGGQGKGMIEHCEPTQYFGKSKKCSCNIKFTDYLEHDHTFTTIESSYFEVGYPCYQNVFQIKYITSAHDPDYFFDFRMPKMTTEQFFRIDTFQIDTIFIYESQPLGGHGGPHFDVDITLIWDTVTISEEVYSGRGKFVINDSFPSFFPEHFWIEQEIEFEFCNE